MSEDYNGPERRREDQIARLLRKQNWNIRALVLIVLSGFVGFYVVVEGIDLGPVEVEGVSDIAERTNELAAGNKEAIIKIETETSQRAQGQAATLALQCTSSNATNAVLRRSGFEGVPDAVNCGELICTALAEINDERPTIEIQDPNGPDFEKQKCPAPPPAPGETSASG